jgi:polysaccharide pyruvyl transferase WcaK-like protein
MGSVNIEVLTHHWVPNFGANLQAYATCRAFSKAGVKTRFCNFRAAEMEAIYDLSVPSEQREMHSAFVARHLTQGPLLRTQSEFEAYCIEHPADIYVTGSDAVFRLKPNSVRADWNFPNPYWLIGLRTGNGGMQPKRIALAASAMGCRFDHLTTRQREDLRNAVDTMDLVSVRDDWTLTQLIRVGVNRHLHLVPDPVFSLRDVMLEKRHSSAYSRKYIVLSTGGALSRAWVQSFTELCAENGFDTLALPTPEGEIDQPVTRVVPLPLDPLEWLDVLCGAYGYVGVRYHPVVCSLIAGAAVVSIDRYHRTRLDARKSKTMELMRMFNADRYCFGGVARRVLSPRKAFTLLHRQQPEIPARQTQAKRCGEQFSEFIQRALWPSQ